MARLLAILIRNTVSMALAGFIHLLLVFAAAFGLPNGSDLQHRALAAIGVCLVVTLLVQGYRLILDLQPLGERQ